MSEKSEEAREQSGEPEAEAAVAESQVDVPAGQGSSGNSPEDGTPDPGWYLDPNAPNQQRYWDGDAWSEKVMPAGAAVSTVRRSPDERKAMLAQQVQQAVGRGLRIESQSDYQAVLVEGKPVNHTLHAILTIFTCLLWGIVWAVIAGTGGERREMIVVDEFGNVQHQKLGKV